MEVNKIYQGNALELLKTFPSELVNCCVTSPPYYGLRDYGMNEQIGLEETPELYVQKLVEVFREVKRVLKDDGTLWLNLGDSYTSDGLKRNSIKLGSGIQANQRAKNLEYEKANSSRGARYYKNINLKPKDLIGIPWMVAFALRADGWYLRSDIIWYKKNPMPESVTDRPTKAHEYVFLLSKSQKYYYNIDAIREPYTSADESPRAEVFNGSRNKAQENGVKIQGSLPQSRSFTNEGKNKRSVWEVNTMPYSEAHFATFPEKLVVDMIKAGCPEGGIVLDPFSGANTTGLVARKLNRNFVSLELNPKYIKIAEKRVYNEIGLFL